MASITQIEKDMLELPAPEREKLALKAWGSLVEDSEAASDPNIDPEGIELASRRDRELDQGEADGISHEEFRRRTGGDE